MHTKLAATLLVASALCTSLIIAQPKAGGPPAKGRSKNFKSPPAPKQVTIAAIPGVIAAGAQWRKAWEGAATADGMAGSDDGGLLFGQEQTNMIGKIDKDDKFSVFTFANGPGGVGITADGRVIGVERTCTDPALYMPDCPEATSITQLTPERKVLADKIGTAGLGRINDLAVGRNGNIYFTTATQSGNLMRLSPAGEVTAVGQGINTNGVTLSPDEKVLYVTNGNSIVAFDLAADGAASNQREFAKLPQGSGGDGITVDAEGRLYVTDVQGATGVHVFDKAGKALGVIPTPRQPITTAFSGQDKKWLYVGTMGVTMGDGKEYIASHPGIRNIAMTIYKVQMQAQGFKGRAK
jgi:gluconolactonase